MKKSEIKLLLFVVLALAVLSGLVALGHQLIWTRRMVDLLGSGATAYARVLGCFFLGLSLGAAVGGFLSRRRSPLLWLAFGEIGVLLACIPIVFLPGWMPEIWHWGGARLIGTSLGEAVKLLLSILAVFMPAFFMGWFLPIAAVIFRKLGSPLDRGGLWLYGLNTFGGALGILAVLFIALPMMGTWHGLLLLLCLNFATAVAFFLCHLRWAEGLSFGLESAMSEVPKNVSQRPPSFRFTALLGISAFSGFFILATEVLLIEMIMLVAPISYLAPGIVVLTIIAILAFGAVFARISFVHEAWISPKAILWGITLLAGLGTFVVPFAFFGVADVLGNFSGQGSLLEFCLKLGLLCALTFGLPIFFAALVFPWITGQLAGLRLKNPEMGWGGILAANGVGGFLGAEVASGWSMPTYGLFQSVGFVSLAYLVAACLIAGWARRPVSRIMACALPLIALGIFVMGGFDRLARLPLVNQNLGWDVLASHTGKEGSIVVVEGPELGRGIVVSNQYLLGSTSARWRQERQAHLPLLLHGDPERIAFLGVATGSSPGGASLYPELKQIDGFEISRQVAAFAKTFFNEASHMLWEDPRFTCYVEDARLGVAAFPQRYDIVVGDLFLPWGVGEARLYSLEHFERVRGSLREGGLFCQWLPMHQLDEANLDIIIDTFAEAFGRVWVFTDGFEATNPSVALVGFRDEQELSWLTVASRARLIRSHGLVLDPLMRAEEGLAMLYLGEWVRERGEQINTLNNHVVELAAVRQYLAPSPGVPLLTGASWMRWTAQAGLATKATPTHLKQALLAGELLRQSHAPSSRGDLANHLRQLERAFPSRVALDTGGDWTSWPGRQSLLPSWVQENFSVQNSP